MTRGFFTGLLASSPAVGERVAGGHQQGPGRKRDLMRLNSLPTCGPDTTAVCAPVPLKDRRRQVVPSSATFSIH